MFKYKGSLGKYNIINKKKDNVQIGKKIQGNTITNTVTGEQEGDKRIAIPM